jgi:UDP-N-acetylmuramoylalanine--D-glutamate ligase
LKREIKKEKIYSKIVNVDIRFFKRNLAIIKNPYFSTEGNQQNLSFIFALAKNFKLKKNILFKTINKFKGLKFRQQIIFKSKKFTLINDSKATSYSSSLDVLKSLKKVFWIVGGVPKFGDQFFMTKKDCINFKVYIYGKNKNHFIKQLKNKIDYQSFNHLKDALKKIIFDIKIEKKNEHKTILFSPSAASFDSFKNFEDRGKKFNIIVKRLNLKKLINV